MLSIRIVLNKNVSFDGCTFISGFHGIGLTGFIAVKHMVKQLDAEKIGFIETKLLPPFVSMDGDEIVTPFEFFRHSNFVFLVVEAPPHAREQYLFSTFLADWIVKSNFSKAILIGGLDKRFKRNEDLLYKFAMTRAFKRKFSSQSFPPLEKELHAFGLLALLLARLEIRDFPALAVLPYADASRPDPFAAAMAIKFVNKFCNLDVDVSELIEEAERIESEVNKLIQQWAERAKLDQRRTLYM